MHLLPSFSSLRATRGQLLFGGSSGSRLSHTLLYILAIRTGIDVPTACNLSVPDDNRLPHGLRTLEVRCASAASPQHIPISAGPTK
mgnify:CR=1 FL=1